MGYVYPIDVIGAPLHESLLGESPVIREVRDMVTSLAPSDLTVLVTGESGTGKDIVARMLHGQSGRKAQPFIKVNCPGLPEGLLESELFGHEKGAFTGARAMKRGRFELADQGTLFLDEIAEVSVGVQGKLMQILDGESFMRVGGVTPVHTDVRVIAATNVILERAVHEQRMREDLYFRLMDVEIHMPPIRDRPEDIPLLAEHFNYHYCRRLRREYVPLPQDSLREMRRDPWPGNVRELGARVKSYVTTGEPEVLRGVGGDVAVGAAPPERSASADPGPHNGETAARSGDGGKARPAPPGPSPSRPIEPLKSAVRRVVEETERSLIEEALQRTLWNRRKAAKLLEISYSSLLRRIDAYEIGKE